MELAIATPESDSEAGAPPSSAIVPGVLGFGDSDVQARLERLQLPFEPSGYDAYGTSKRALQLAFRWLEPLYKNYFRVRCHDIQRVPTHTRAMLVPNHSGGVGIDAAMTICACFFELEPPRLAQGMADMFLNRLPLASLITSRTGQLTGLREHAARLLADERLLLVFPEGARGTAKLFTERRTVQSFPLGFMRLAMQTNTPIIPVGILGAGEALPTVLNLAHAGRWLGVPYLPLTPYLLPVPLPARFELYFGQPLSFAGTGHEENDEVSANVERVRTAIESLLQSGASKYRVV